MLRGLAWRRMAESHPLSSVSLQALRLTDAAVLIHAPRGIRFGDEDMQEDRHAISSASHRDMICCFIIIYYDIL